MKVLNEGDPMLALPWWQRITVKCRSCGWEAFEFDKGDLVENGGIVKLREATDERPTETMVMSCPTCGNKLVETQESK